MINPEALAAEIVANCDAYDAGIINRARWDVEQQRLWKAAADVCLAQVVLTFVLRTSANGLRTGLTCNRQHKANGEHGS